MIKFSIVITTYNRRDYLERAVRSSLTQTLPCEVIVVDDGSSDGTEDYLRGLGDSIVYHRNEVNLGHSTSVNIGVGLASGNWIKLVDDDDYLSPDCIEVITDNLNYFIKNNKNVVICSCQAVTVNESETTNYIVQQQYSVYYIPQKNIHYQMLFDLLPFGTPIQVAFEKEAFLKSGGWDSEYDGNYDDINAWVKICRYGDAITISLPLVFRMIWRGSVHQQLSLEEKCDVNIGIKKNIITQIPLEYRDRLPELTTIEDYVTLHWFFVGLKRGKLGEGFQLAKEKLFSFRAWWLLLNIRLGLFNLGRSSPLKNLSRNRKI